MTRDLHREAEGLLLMAIQAERQNIQVAERYLQRAVETERKANRVIQG